MPHFKGSIEGSNKKVQISGNTETGIEAIISVKGAKLVLKTDCTKGGDRFVLIRKFEGDKPDEIISSGLIVASTN